MSFRLATSPLAPVLGKHVPVRGQARLLHELLGYLITAGDRCIDVGASMDVHTIRLAQLAGPAGEVIAIEPDPELARRTMTNAALDGLASIRMVVQTSTIDEVCTAPVALIKIAMAGHEGAVIDGAARTIQMYSPAVVFGYAPELLAERSQSPFGRLADAGYRLFRIGHRRHRLTGRTILELAPLAEQPDLGGDLLAVSPARATRISALVRPR
jgi:hypothetical protein